MDNPRMSRRFFLRAAAMTAAGVTIVACQPQTIVVEKEKVVKETVVVEKEKVVEKQVKTEPTLVRFHGRMGTQGDHFIHFAKLFSDDNFPNLCS